MFDFDVGKILIVAVVALVVVGPKDLPRVLVTLARALRTARGMATDFRRQAMDMINEVDDAGIYAKLEGVNRAVADFARDPSTAMRASLPGAGIRPRRSPRTAMRRRKCAPIWRRWRRPQAGPRKASPPRSRRPPDPLVRSACPHDTMFSDKLSSILTSRVKPVRVRLVCALAIW